ncbi:hypothetical protein CRG98_022586 [Punica granatum]|uniref:Uncharacterized protein n=1 Tax=Punica granatum TaxID=22663 RepID=A0A2I0JLD0_PUNGR|nr:hypothetical protein CRG98_022586 [Punica granatum]
MYCPKISSRTSRSGVITNASPSPGREPFTWKMLIMKEVLNKRDFCSVPRLKPVIIRDPLGLVRELVVPSRVWGYLKGLVADHCWIKVRLKLIAIMLLMLRPMRFVFGSKSCLNVSNSIANRSMVAFPSVVELVNPMYSPGAITNACPSPGREPFTWKMLIRKEVLNKRDFRSIPRLKPVIVRDHLRPDREQVVPSRVCGYLKGLVANHSRIKVFVSELNDLELNAEYVTYMYIHMYIHMKESMPMTY